MSKPIPPCRACKDNHAECKKTCEPFKEWEKVYTEYREKVNKQKKLENDLAGMRVTGCENSRRFSRAMKGRNG